MLVALSKIQTFVFSWTPLINILCNNSCCATTTLCITDRTHQKIKTIAALGATLFLCPASLHFTFTASIIHVQCCSAAGCRLPIVLMSAVWFPSAAL